MMSCGCRKRRKHCYHKTCCKKKYYKKHCYYKPVYRMECKRSYGGYGRHDSSGYGYGGYDSHGGYDSKY